MDDACAGERILVFEFTSRGSLYDRLHKNNKGTLTTDPLSWASRMDIAFQVALALQYLHEEANPPILHRDVKSANVLLENNNLHSFHRPSLRGFLHRRIFLGHYLFNRG